MRGRRITVGSVAISHYVLSYVLSLQSYLISEAESPLNSSAGEQSARVETHQQEHVDELGSRFGGKQTVPVLYTLCSINRRAKSIAYTRYYCSQG